MKFTIKNIAIVTTFIMLPVIASAATLSVSPSSQSVKAGDIFSVSVYLDTQGSSIDGVDLRYLNYNPKLLQVQDSGTTQAGIQISPGNLMPSTLLNKVDQTAGRIAFSQVAAGGTKYKGSGKLAVISFKALSAGNASLTFDYTPKSTTDSNVAMAGSDALNAVVNGVYTIIGSTVKQTAVTPVVTPKTSRTNEDSSSSGPTNLDRVSGDSFVPLTPDEVDNSIDNEVDSSNIFVYIISRIKNGLMRLFGR